MSKEYDGGPAFPIASEFDERRGEMVRYGTYGMSLRDYFAARAMASLMISAFGDPHMTPDVLAEEAYQWADAMLKARAQ